MGRARREARKAKKNKDELRQEHAERVQRLRKQRLIVGLVPFVVGGAAAYANWGLEQPSLAGAVLLGGAIVWLMLALGLVGSQVSARDRGRAGSIDFGNRR